MPSTLYAPTPAEQAVSKAGVIITDADLRIVHIEGSIFERHGLDPIGWRGRRLSEILPPRAVEVLGPRYWAAAGGEPQSFDYRTLDGDGVYWVQIDPIRDECGRITSVMAVMQEITDRLRVTAELARSEARLSETEHLVGVGSWEIDVRTGVITFSEGFRRLLRLPEGATLDIARYTELVHPEDRARMSEGIERALRTGSASAEYRVTRADGDERIVLAEGRLIADEHHPWHLRGAILDVTEQRRAESERLEAVSLFEDGFEAAPIGMALTDAQDGHYVRVNDAMCALLQRNRKELLGARFIDLTHPDERERDREARDAMLAGTLTHHATEKRYLRPDGTAVWAALHVVAVRRPDGTVRAFFSQIIDISERKAHEQQVEHDVRDAVWLGRVRRAIDEDRLVLYSQPIIDLTTGHAVQQELLLRMVAEDGSIVAPGDFLPVAERYGLISEIDRWVIRQAVGLAATGATAEFNISGASIGDPAVLREIEEALAETGADPALLTIEVTETAIMHQVEEGRVFAQRVSDLGCTVALDDFGVGWGSLTYLKHFPVQHLKIDIEFVRDVARNEADERLVRGIVGLAREFDLATTAEGIEDEATLVRLRELGVDRGQGYLFGRPQPLIGAAAARSERAAARPGCPNPVEVVKSVYGAFAARDVDSAISMFEPDGVIRVFAKAALADRREPYRGHDGIRDYFRDVARYSAGLRFETTAFHQAADTVIVFGSASSQGGGGDRGTDVLWLWRLERGRIASVEVFPAARRA